jgi:GTPase SAR1 family protein
VLGDAESSKTDLLKTMMRGAAPGPDVVTTYDTYESFHDCNGKSIHLQYWDVDCGDEHESLRPLSYPNTDAFLICFSIANRASFELITTKVSSFYYICSTLCCSTHTHIRTHTHVTHTS